MRLLALPCVQSAKQRNEREGKAHLSSNGQQWLGSVQGKRTHPRSYRKVRAELANPFALSGVNHELTLGSTSGENNGFGSGHFGKLMSSTMFQTDLSAE